MQAGIDLTGEITGVPNTVIMWGEVVWGHIVVDAPDDYTPEDYDYIDGNFIRKES